MPEFQQLQFGGLDTPKALPKRAPAEGFDGSTPREAYPHAPGQQVMGVHDLSQQHELDRHGNVVDPSFPTNGFRNWGPQMSSQNRKVWDKHAERRSIRIDSVMHTGQGADITDDHSYISGPLQPDSRTAVYVHHGTPFIVDGHHRLAEARGRGETHFHAEVLNGDKIPKRHVEMPAKKDAPGVVQHLVADHGFSNESVDNGAGNNRGAAKWALQRHAESHDQNLFTHTHTPNNRDNPQSRRADVPDAKQTFMDNAQPRQFGANVARKLHNLVNRPPR